MPKAKPKPTDDKKTQRERFIEAARKAGVSEDPEAFDKAFKRVVPAKPRPRIIRKA